MIRPPRAVPARWTHAGLPPPPGARLDFGHPLTRDLVFAGLFNEWNSRRITNWTRQSSAAQGPSAGMTPTTALTWTAAGGGSGLLFPGGLPTTDKYLNYGADRYTADLGYDRPFTLMARLFWKGGDAGIAARNDSNSVNQGWQTQVKASGTNAGLLYTVEGSSVNGIYTAPAPSTNTWFTWAITDAVAATRINGISLYVDGVPQTVGHGATLSGTRGSDAAQTLNIGRTNFSSGGGSVNAAFDGYMGWLYLWKRVLASAEILALQWAPYQFVVSPYDQAFEVAVGSGIAPGRRVRFHWAA